MTDYYDVPIVYTGDWIDAAWLNQYVGDNLRAFKQGFVNAGDVPYALDSNTIAALAKPSVDSLFKMLSTGVPAYVDVTKFPGIVHAFGQNYSDTGGSTGSLSLTATGIGFNLTLTTTCTVYAFGIAFGYKNAGGALGYFALRIDGTNDPNELVQFSDTYERGYPLFYRRTGITSGSRNVSLYYKSNNAGNGTFWTRALAFAFAVPE